VASVKLVIKIVKTSFAIRLNLFLLVAILLVPITTLAQFTFTTNNGAITITSYTGLGGNVVIPGYINGYPVKTIGDNAFYNCFTLTNVVISNCVAFIGNEAFRYCGNLTNVTLGSSVVGIGNYAFYMCDKLNGVTFPNSITNIGDYAFYNCSAMTNLTIPSSVTSIGYLAFSIGNLYQVYFEGNAPIAGKPVFMGGLGTVYYLPGTIGWGSTFGGWPTARWYQSQPQILGLGYGLGVKNNKFQFTISWATNTTVVVEASTNLHNWTPVITNWLFNGTNIFSDSAYTNIPKRFYRVHSQ
jgi:hypothetical protein